MNCLPRSTPDMQSSLGHVFGPDLTCTHTNCEMTWKEHQAAPLKCEGIQRLQRGWGDKARRERENADE